MSLLLVDGGCYKTCLPGGSIPHKRVSLFDRKLGKVGFWLVGFSVVASQHGPSTQISDWKQSVRSTQRVDTFVDLRSALMKVHLRACGCCTYAGGRKDAKWYALYMVRMHTSCSIVHARHAWERVPWIIYSAQGYDAAGNTRGAVHTSSRAILNGKPRSCCTGSSSHRQLES